MRWSTAIGALGVLFLSVPANAAFEFDVGPIEVSGTQTTTVIQTGCLPVFCSQTTVPSTSSFRDSLLGGSAETLEGTFVLSGSDPFTRINGNVTLTFLGGVLQSSSFFGLSWQLVGRCPDNCTSYDGSYSAQSFAIGIFDTTTGVRRIVAPVPEPATWVMMMLGFGAMGVALRRRKRANSMMHVA